MSSERIIASSFDRAAHANANHLRGDSLDFDRDGGFAHAFGKAYTKKFLREDFASHAAMRGMTRHEIFLQEDRATLLTMSRDVTKTLDSCWFLSRSRFASA